MKKFLNALALCFLLTACGSGDDTTPSASTPASSPDSTGESAVAQETAAEFDCKNFRRQISERVYRENDVSLFMEGFNTYNDNTMTLWFRVDNESPEVLEVSALSLQVNGYFIEVDTAPVTVPAGEKYIDVEFAIDMGQIRAFSMTELESFDVSWQIFFTDSSTTEQGQYSYVDEGDVSSEEGTVDNSQMFGTMEPVLVHDGDGVFAEFLGFEQDGENYSMIFNVSNETEKSYSLMVNDFTLNGFVASTSYPTLRSGTELTRQNISIDMKTLDHCNFEAFIEGSFRFTFLDTSVFGDTTVRCEPVSFATSNQGVFTQSLPATGEFLAEVSNTKIYYQGYEVLRGDSEPSLIFLVDNQSSEVVSVMNSSIDSLLTFDGVEYEGSGGLTILPNTWGILVVNATILGDSIFPDSFSTCSIDLSSKSGDVLLNPYVLIDTFELKG